MSKVCKIFQLPSCRMRTLVFRPLITCGLPPG